LKKAIENHHNQSRQPFYTEDKQAYRSWVLDTFSIGYLSIDDKQRERDVKKDQHQQTVKRYQLLNQVLKGNYSIDKSKATDFDSRLDKILTHKFFGYVIFLALLLVMFQAIFTW